MACVCFSSVSVNILMWWVDWLIPLFIDGLWPCLGHVCSAPPFSLLIFWFHLSIYFSTCCCSFCMLHQFTVGTTEDLLCNDRTFSRRLSWNSPAKRSVQTSRTSRHGTIVPDSCHWFTLIGVIPSVLVKKRCYVVSYCRICTYYWVLTAFCCGFMWDRSFTECGFYCRKSLPAWSCKITYFYFHINCSLWTPVEGRR